MGSPPGGAGDISLTSRLTPATFSGCGNKSERVGRDEGATSYHFPQFLLEEGLKSLIDNALYLDAAQQGYIVFIEPFDAFHLEVPHDGVVVDPHPVVAINGVGYGARGPFYQEAKVPPWLRKEEEVAAIASDEEWVGRVKPQVKLCHVLNRQFLPLSGNSNAS